MKLIKAAIDLISTDLLVLCITVWFEIDWIFNDRNSEVVFEVTLWGGERHLNSFS